jgi:hypothetical protein
MAPSLSIEIFSSFVTERSSYPSLTRRAFGKLGMLFKSNGTKQNSLLWGFIFSEFLIFLVISFAKISSSSLSETSMLVLGETRLSTISDKFTWFVRSNFSNFLGKAFLGSKSM